MDSDNKNVLCVPLASLSEGETAPEPGEEIQATIEGVVVHVEGGDAYIHVSKVNETPAPPDGGEEAPEDDGGDDLRAQGQASDEQEEQP